MGAEGSLGFTEGQGDTKRESEIEAERERMTERKGERNVDGR